MSRSDNPSTKQPLKHIKNLPRYSKCSDYEALVAALKAENMRGVHLLLGNNCQVTKPDSEEHPLHLAVGKLGWYKIVEKLLAVGARVTDRDGKGDTALHVAFFNYASDKVLDLLLQRYLQETDENIANKEGITFLHIACTRRNVEIIRDFVIRGQCDVNSQIPTSGTSIFSGCTPLHLAVEYGQPNMVRFLLEHNAELYARDCNGSTPLHYALERRDVQNIDLILSYDYRRENVVNNFGLSHLMAACVGTNEKVVVEFLRVIESQSKISASDVIKQACTDLNYYKFAGYTSLNFAAEFGHRQTVQLLNDVAERHIRLTLSPEKSEEAEGRRQISYERKAYTRSGRSFGYICYLITFLLLLTIALSFSAWLLLV